MSVLPEETTAMVVQLVQTRLDLSRVPAIQDTREMEFHVLVSVDLELLQVRHARF